MDITALAFVTLLMLVFFAWRRETLQPGLPGESKARGGWRAAGSMGGVHSAA